MSSFFGNLSPFDIIVATVAFTTSVYTFYKSFIEGPRIAIYPAGNVGLVVAPNGRAARLNSPCNVVNTGSKVGTLHHLEVNMLSPCGARYVLAWNQFYRYKEGGGEQDKVSDTYPVAVSQHDSRLLFVQFQLVSPHSSIGWCEGDYEFTLHGWVNSQNRQQRPNVIRQFHVRIDAQTAQSLSQCHNHYVVCNVVVQEWQPWTVAHDFASGLAWPNLVRAGLSPPPPYTAGHAF